MKTNTEIRKYVKEAIKSNHPVKEIESVIDIIKQDMINDFDSRTCDNCKFFDIKDKNCETGGWCKELNKYEDETFGCNEFKIKPK